MAFWDVFPECSEVLVYLQMLRRLPRLLNYSLAYLTLSLSSKGEGIGNLGARQRLREKPLALLVRPKSPFPSVLRLNVKLSEVLLLRLRAISHTLPLFYYATVEIDLQTVI